MSKLQFAFGNPRRVKKGKKSKKKSVAARGKRRKNKAKPSNAHSRTVAVAKKKARKRAKSRAGKRARKNPMVYQARKNGKLIGGGKFFTAPELAKKRANDPRVKKIKAAYDKAPYGSPQKQAARKALAHAMATVDQSKLRKDTAAALKDLQRYEEDGAKVTTRYVAEGKGSSVAKKRRKKKSSAAKSAKRGSKKRAHKRKKKGGGKRRSAAQKRALKKMLAAGKAARRAKKSGKKRPHKRRKHAKRAKVAAAPQKTRRSRRRKGKRSKTYAHRHAKSTRHLKKGTRFKFKSSAGKGRKKVSVSGFFKINPFRRNPMANVSANLKKYLGMSGEEVAALAVGGALVPVVNAGIAKIPGADKIVGLINQYLGPQATGSVVPILVGVGMNVLADQFATGKSKEYAKLAGEGLAAAGVLGLAMGMSQRYVVEGMMSGVLYTPMNGINYTPMSGPNVQMGIYPQLAGRMGQRRDADFGIYPQLAGQMGVGYTERQKRSPADFGRMGRDADFGSINYTPMSGPNPWAMDEDVDEQATEDDILDETLSGSMG